MNLNRIEILIAGMTLAEKLGQLTMTACGSAVTGPTIAGDSTEAIKSGAIGNLLNLVGIENIRQMQRLAVEESRLGIPLMVGLDVVHGYRTLFPVPLAEAALFDPAAWAATAREAALEAAADGMALTFAPMLDVSRDPRWGRGVEGPGEDPWLASRFAEAKVRGFQSLELPRTAAQPRVPALGAVAKHFCGYGPVTAGREYASVDISERTLFEVHMPSFAAAVAAGVAAIMPAFTDLAGIPMTAHVPLLNSWLRGRLGFDGVIISDYNAIPELLHHGVAADLAESAALAMNAGVDIDMMGGAYRHGLPAALQRGLVSLAQIDAAVRRVLILKQSLGLFDDPYRSGNTESSQALKDRRQLARDVAARAVVMLKNDAGTLPLGADLGAIALIGPLADASAEMRGPWWGAAETTGHVTVLEGLRALLTRTRILHARGVGFDDADRTSRDADAEIAAALETLETAHAAVLCVGECNHMSGEAASRAHLDLPGRQRDLVQAVFAKARGLRIPVIVIVFSGRPLVCPWLIAGADAVLAAWFLGSEAGNALADIIVGRTSPSGRLPVSWPRALGQVPLFFAQRPSGRPANIQDRFTSKYLDEANEPQFPFGFGLTYGQFSYSNLQVTPARATERARIEVRVDVANDGEREAEETVLLFTHDKVASVVRPVLDLQCIGKIRLPAGTSGSVTLSIPAEQLKFLDAHLDPIFEPGDVEILVGPCADRGRLLAATIELIAE